MPARPIGHQSRNQALAPFRTPRVENLASATRFHARAEAVRACVLEVAGLEGALGGHDTNLVLSENRDFRGKSVLASIARCLACPVRGVRLRYPRTLQRM